MLCSRTLCGTHFFCLYEIGQLAKPLRSPKQGYNLSFTVSSYFFWLLSRLSPPGNSLWVGTYVSFGQHRTCESRECGSHGCCCGRLSPPSSDSTVLGGVKTPLASFDGYVIRENGNVLIAHRSWQARLSTLIRGHQLGCT